MTAAGEGYRVVVGWIVLIIDAGLFVTAIALLWCRGHLNPLKPQSPVLLASMLPMRIVGVFWVQLRELGWITFACHRVVWFALVLQVMYTVPVLIWSYRLVLVWEFESHKVALAAAAVAGARALQRRVSVAKNLTKLPALPPPVVVGPRAAFHGSGNGNGAGDGSGGAAPTPTTRAGGGGAVALDGLSIADMRRYHSTRRMLLLLFVGCVPAFVIASVFERYDTSYDWSHVGSCSYHNLLVVPYVLQFLISSACGMYLQKRLDSLAASLSANPKLLAAGNGSAVAMGGDGVASFKAGNGSGKPAKVVEVDAWGMRRTLKVMILYAQTCMLSFIVLNAAYPDVNFDFIESAYLPMTASLIRTVHMIILPALQTFNPNVPQQTHPSAANAKRHLVPPLPVPPSPHLEAKRPPALQLSPLAAAVATGGRVGGAGGGGSSSTPPVGRVRHPSDGSVAFGGGGGSSSGPASNRSSGPPSSNRWAHHPGAGGGAGGGGGDETGRRGGGGAVSVTRRTGGGVNLSEAQMLMTKRPLYRILSDPIGYELFLTHLKSEFAAENVLFYSAVEEYRNTDDFDGGGGVTVDQALSIYHLYVAPHTAPLQVNLSADVVNAITGALAPYLHSNSNSSGAAAAAAAAAGAAPASPLGGGGAAGNGGRLFAPASTLVAHARDRGGSDSTPPVVVRARAASGASGGGPPASPVAGSSSSSSSSGSNRSPRTVAAGVVGSSADVKHNNSSGVVVVTSSSAAAAPRPSGPSSLTVEPNNNACLSNHNTMTNNNTPPLRAAPPPPSPLRVQAAANAAANAAREEAAAAAAAGGGGLASPGRTSASTTALMQSLPPPPAALLVSPNAGGAVTVTVNTARSPTAAGSSGRDSPSHARLVAAGGGASPQLSPQMPMPTMMRLVNVFDAAQVEIFALMESHSLVRFKATRAGVACEGLWSAHAPQQRHSPRQQQHHDGGGHGDASPAASGAVAAHSLPVAIAIDAPPPLVVAAAEATAATLSPRAAAAAGSAAAAKHLRPSPQQQHDMLLPGASPRARSDSNNPATDR